MSMYESKLAAPVAYNARDCTSRGAGRPITVWESTFTRGDVIGVYEPELAVAISSVENVIDGENGLGCNGGLLRDATDGFAMIVTNPGTTAAGFDVKAVERGRMYVSITFEDAGGGQSNALAIGDVVYLVEDQKFCTTNASLAGETVGRKCGVVREVIAQDDRTAGAASPVLCDWTGTPDYLD